MKQLIRENKLVIILISTILFINLIIKVFDIDLNFECNSERFGYSEFDVKGVVIDKYLDKRNHNTSTITVETEDTVYNFMIIHDQKTKLFDFIEVSDSIFNDSGSFKIRIKRENVDTTILWQSSVSEPRYRE